jgi:hypothetical protein
MFLTIEEMRRELEFDAISVKSIFHAAGMLVRFMLTAALPLSRTNKVNIVVLDIEICIRRDCNCSDILVMKITARNQCIRAKRYMSAYIHMAHIYTYIWLQRLKVCSHFHFSNSPDGFMILLKSRESSF